LSGGQFVSEASNKMVKQNCKHEWKSIGIVNTEQTLFPNGNYSIVYSCDKCQTGKVVNINKVKIKKIKGQIK